MKRIIEILLLWFSRKADYNNVNAEIEQTATETTETKTKTETPSEMKITDKGKDLIKKYEGLSLKAYRCPANVWTIGYGHTKCVKQTDVISVAEAEAYLLEDITPIERWLSQNMRNLNQNQFDALCSFCFNLGINAFADSTLRKKIDEGAEIYKIEEQFMRWVYCGRVVSQGLTNRRKAEVKLYCE